MELSIFLAKLLGLYFLIITADIFLRRSEIAGAVRDFAGSKGLLVFAGSLSLLFGLSIAIAHPVFEANWRGLITLLGYFMIFQGIMRVAFPTLLQSYVNTIFEKGYWVFLTIILVLGLFLTYAGFHS